MTKPSVCLHTQLKSKTREVHRQLEHLPFFSALQKNDLRVEAIVTHLRSLAIIHAVVERRLKESLVDQRLQEKNECLGPLWNSVMAKLPLLLADLRLVDKGSPFVILPAIQKALALAAELLRKSEDSLTLLGSLYVLEGSQMGGLYLRKSFARALQVEETSLSYFGCYGSKTAEIWQEFVKKINQLNLNPSDSEKVVQGAVLVFEGIFEIISALWPFEPEDSKPHIAAINPEAGNHAIPDSVENIALALFAGQRAWTKFPYLEARFGERGRRFTSSDSCWLVAQYFNPNEEACLRNLRWLRRTLAVRGLPSIILEEHLISIHSEIQKKHGVSSPHRFEKFLRELGEIREKHLPLNLQQGLGFAGEEESDSLGAMKLVTSAWLDEESGIPGALAVTFEWFTDRQNGCSEGLILSLRKLVEELDNKRRKEHSHT